MNTQHLRLIIPPGRIKLAVLLLSGVLLFPSPGYSQKKSNDKDRHRPTSISATPKRPPDDSHHKERYFQIRLTQIREIDASNQAAGGEAGADQIRIAPADYPDDGSGATVISDDLRSNARTISNRLVQQLGNEPNARGLSNMMWAWGQFLDHDITLTLTDAGNGFANIAIEDPNDPLSPGPIFLDRSDFVEGSGTAGNPRIQPNSITSFIDASNVYGSDSVRAAVLREFAGGRLRTSEGDMPPANDVGLPNAGAANGYLVGDIRGNENVVLTSLHTLFVREHNRIAGLLQLMAPDSSDEEIFQLARKIIQAQLQRITYEEFLPALLGGPISETTAASPSLPSISTEFSTASYRFGHSTLSSQIDLIDANGTTSISLTNAFFNPDFLIAAPANVDALLAGVSVNPCQEVDPHVVEDLRTFLFGPPGAGGFDLAALNIQRGRDHGLADYNSMREAFGLNRVSQFSEITSDPTLQADLEELYGSVDNIDAWIGGLAEDHISGGSVGPLVQAVLTDQFSRLRIADNLFHTRDQDLRSPIVEAALNLHDHSLYETILANTSVRQLSESPFFAGSQIETDIRVTYNPDTNRIHVVGNRENNSVMLIDSGFGVHVFAGTGSSVNGKASVLLPADRKPNLTIDLGKGSDTVALINLNLKNAVVALGNENETFNRLLVTMDSLITDVPEDQQPLIPSQQDSHRSRSTNPRR